MSAGKADWDDERLKEAFQLLAESPDAQEDDVDGERIWQAVSGELPAEERRELVEAIASDPARAEAWRLANELWQSSQRADGVVPIEAARRRSIWYSPGLVAAALLLVALAVGIVTQMGPGSSDPVFRGTVRSLVPDESALPRESFVLRWEPVSDAARYHVRVTTSDLQVVANVSDLERPEYQVPEERLRALSSGARVFWQVEARLDDGTVIESPTFITELQ